MKYKSFQFCVFVALLTSAFYLRVVGLFTASEFLRMLVSWQAVHLVVVSRLVTTTANDRTHRLFLSILRC